MTNSTPLVAAAGLSVGYGDLVVARDLDIEINAGEIVALIGPNGVGKTTLLLTLSGAIPALAGEVLVDGVRSTAPLHKRIRRGLGYVLEERSITSGLTVRDNLRLGGGDLDFAFDLFPELKPLYRRSAGLLSGGEQQMLALARSLATRPSLLLVDELSLGLAPIVVERLLAAITAAAKTSAMGVLLVEQQVERALGIADRWHLMRHGRMHASGHVGPETHREVMSSFL